MTTFLLDTNVCVEYLRRRNDKVIQRIQNLRPVEMRLCLVVVGELYYGAWKSPQPQANLSLLARFLPTFHCLPFDEDAAAIYGRLRVDLETSGRMIGPNDTMIAAIALANDATLVTHNVTEFNRVPNLKIEDWQS